MMISAEEHLRQGDPAQALQALQEQVRSRPGDARLRVFLFQLLCVLGQWQRALTQLETVAGLDPAALLMKQMYGDAVRCEMLRAEIFAGRKAPMVLGQPETWLALLIESLLRTGQGDVAQARELRARAFEEAPEVAGTLDGQTFSWIADADMRLGPVLEAIINGRYYWLPFARLRQLRIEAPSDLRDAVWLPAQLEFDNGGESLALIPTRYAGSQTSSDGLIALARKTVWDEPEEGFFCGQGQRLLSTDTGDFALMDVRLISFAAAVADPSLVSPESSAQAGG